eukprot:4257777-Alexandrium_andersonii.AAC.1
MARGSRRAAGAGQAAPSQPPQRPRWCCRHDGAWPMSRRVCGILAPGRALSSWPTRAASTSS